MYSDYYDSIGKVAETDKEVADAMALELKRQRENIELIASENLVSPQVMAAMGSVLTNKYAEGLPGKRYYGGCQYVDIVENIAIKRACELFKCNYANVQPHSGAQANTAVYLALLKPGDTVMGMSLDNGGHLTHGSPANISGKYFNFVPYGVDENGFIDYKEFAKQVNKVKPKLVVAGASAYPREIDFKTMADIAHANGAMFMVDMAHIAGLVASGHHPSPVPYAHVTTTTTHKTLRGPRGGLILTNDEAIAKKINSAIFPGLQGGPLMHVIAGKAVTLKEALAPAFKEYGEQVIKNAAAMAEVFNQHSDFRVISGGTDNHVFLVDVTKVVENGKLAQNILESVNITLNKNSIPFETLSPFKTSGIRIGSPAITSRGMGENESRLITELIVKALENYQNETILEEVRREVKALTDAFPLY